MRFINGKIDDAIRVHCQVVHMTANGMGLSIHFYELNKKEQVILGQIIATEKTTIEALWSFLYNCTIILVCYKTYNKQEVSTYTYGIKYISSDRR